MKQQRNTKQRQRILNAVKSRRDHPTADQIYQDIRIRDPKISRGTVYRNLNLLAERGEILQIKIPGADRFDLRRELHHHILCLECGGLFDAALPYSRDLDEAAAEKSGFQIHRHHTLFEGVCPHCQNP